MWWGCKWVWVTFKKNGFWSSWIFKIKSLPFQNKGGCVFKRLRQFFQRLWWHFLNYQIHFLSITTFQDKDFYRRALSIALQLFYRFRRHPQIFESLFNDRGEFFDLRARTFLFFRHSPFTFTKDQVGTSKRLTTPPLLLKNQDQPIQKLRKK